MSVIIGNKLRQAREEKGVSVEQAVESTYIHSHYLRAMEAGDFEIFPSRAQARGFLRAYADYLNLDSDSLLEDFDVDPLTSVMRAADASKREEPPSEPEFESKKSLASVGETLKSQRELLGLSLDDVERHTHLRNRYLQALEDGNLDALPSTTQGSGMLKNYANFLSLDPEPLLLRFAEELQSRLPERRPKTPPQTEEKPQQDKKRLRIGFPFRFFSRDLVIGGLIVVFLVVFAVWAGMRIATARSSGAPEPTPPSIAEVLLPSPTASLEPTSTATVLSPLEEAAEEEFGGAAPEETQDPLALEAVQGTIRVQFVVYQRAWVRVTVDGEVDFNGRVIPGSTYAFSGEESVELLTGNGESLQVIFNDEDLGTIGEYGEIVNIVFTTAGIQTPTPTISPTPTRTPRTTPTATLTTEPEENP